MILFKVHVYVLLITLLMIVKNKHCHRIKTQSLGAHNVYKMYFLFLSKQRLFLYKCLVIKFV